MWGLEIAAVLAGPAWQKTYLALCVVTGAMMCFYGYRAFRLALGLFGALAGGYAAAAVGFAQTGGNHTVALLCGLMGGALGGVLMVTMYLLGVFVLGAALGGMLGAGFCMGAGADIRLVVIAVLAVIGGSLALVVQRTLIIVATSMNGAALVVGGMWMLWTGTSPAGAYGAYVAAGEAAAESMAAGISLHKYFLVGGWATLGCIGAWAQFSAPELEEEAEDEDDEEE